MQKIPLSHCFVNEEVESAVLRALRSGHYILGQECQAFEAELAAQVGTGQAVLCSSWTMGVFLALRAIGLKPGDEVVVPSHTAFPTIEPLLHAGATPVFVDVDETYCLDVKQVEGAITPRTVGILPVHLYGHPADLDPLLEIAGRRHLWLIEDCAQAQGARYKGQAVGSKGWLGAFSFYPSKNLTVLGDGGCLCTDDAGLAEKLRMLRNHGRKEKYKHEIPGFNVRFNEIQAAIGRVALRHLDGFNEQRRRIAGHYAARLQGIVQTPPEREWATAVYHMYVIRTPKREALARHLQSQGIGTGIHYPIPNHQQPAVTQLFSSLPRLPRTEQWVGEILSLPIHGEMELEKADQVCDAIAAFFKTKT